MKQFLLLAISLLILSCNNNDVPLKGPEYLQHRISKGVLISKLKDIDSADVNVQYIKKTQYLFKKSSSNNLEVTVYIKPDLKIDDQFIDNHVKLYKLTLERELLNYFSYDGLIINFYQKGEKLHSYEQSFKE